ncbi:signal peptidase I [Polymorphobacter sp.]|uniref:signal peptidase I n=1 Tax=Polymorphobacter sp. TaxID=1909290 RepID=UPI003F701147
MINETYTADRNTWLTELRSMLGLMLLVFAIHGAVAKPFYIPSESMMPGLQVGDRLIVSRFPYGWSYASVPFHLLPPLEGRLLGSMPQRGDVVIVAPLDAAHHGEDLIKRVIGLPGDMVQLVSGRLWLNGQPVRAAAVGPRLLPVDGNFHCDADDADPQRAFPGFSGARVIGTAGRLLCKINVVRETLPGGRSYETLDFGPSASDNMPPYLVPEGRVFLMGDNRDNSADSRVAVAFGGLGGAVPVESLGGRAEFITFSLSGSTSWNPLSWPAAFRRDRFGLPLRPAEATNEPVGTGGPT